MAPLPLEDGSSRTPFPHSLLPLPGLVSLMDGLAKHLPEPLENDGVCKKLEKLSKSMQVTLPNSLPLSQVFYREMKARPRCSEEQKSLPARGPGGLQASRVRCRALKWGLRAGGCSSPAAAKARGPACCTRGM